MTALMRFLAGLVLLVAVIFAVNDATRSQAGHASHSSIYDSWSASSPSTLKSAREAVQRYTHAVVWNWAAVPMLRLPAWLLLGMSGFWASP